MYSPFMDSCFDDPGTITLALSTAHAAMFEFEGWLVDAELVRRAGPVAVTQLGFIVAGVGNVAAW